MADRIVISNVQPFDGAYTLDFEEEPLTTREWRWIKQISGYLPGTARPGFEGDDPDLILALAVIAMVRANKISRGDVLDTADQLADVPRGRLTLTASEQEADARPPEPSENGNSSPTGSGESSSPPTGQLVNHQSPIGEPTSPTPAISGPVT